MEANSETPLTPDSPAPERIPEIIARLQEAHPDAGCALAHTNPFELLVATVLSAQCTDERVNQVTPAIFDRYPTPEAMATADREELEGLVRPTGFYRQKARFIHESAEMIADRHDGKVPPNMDALVGMPGVARKTANVVLGVAFGLAEGIVVDTHVKRLSRRLGLTQQSDPNKIEQDLMRLVARPNWIDFAHLLIFHGRRVCKARKPECPNCVLRALCPSADL
jgi:endonuclease-3